MVFDAIFNMFEKLISDFSWKRLIFFFLFIAILIGAITFFESYTKYFEMKKIEKQIALFNQISKIGTEEVFKKDPELKSIYASIKKNLKKITTTPSVERVIKTFIPQWIWKFIAGAFLWFLFCAAYIPGMRKREKESVNAFIGLLVVGIIAGTIGAFLPNRLGNAVLYLFYPIGHFLLVCFLILVVQAIKSKRSNIK